jgi:methionyl-tRNA formyltransferase
MRVVFVGTPDFALESLKAVIADGHEVVAVITAPDKPKGRGMKMAESEVKTYAVANNIPVYQPEKIRKNPEFIEEIKNLNADIACVVVYGKILPKSFLDLFKFGCINVHPSLLPKYRGSAPIQWAIINGDKITGVCTMYLDVGMDDGDVILREEVSIGDDETAGELWSKLSSKGAKLLVKTLENIGNGIIIREKQVGQVTIAPKLEKEMSKIDWENMSAIQIKNLVRGLNPGFGTYTFLNDKKFKFWKIDVMSNEEFEKMRLEKLIIEKADYTSNEKFKEDLQNKENGEVLISSDKLGLFIKAKDGVVSVLEIQGENAKKMGIRDFLRGNKMECGAIFK